MQLSNNLEMGFRIQAFYIVLTLLLHIQSNYNY